MLGSSSEKSERYFKAFQELKVREEQLQNPVFADERQTLAMKQIDTVLVTAQSQHSHSTVTAQSQHSHSTVTAQSQHSLCR